MMHWSASKKDEYCFGGNTAALSLCGVAKSCPESDEFAALWDTSFISDGRFRTRPVPAADESPAGRTRRRKLLGHWLGAGL